MKKIFLFLAIISFATQSNGQFLNSIGITGGISYGNQKFKFADPVFIARKKYFFAYNASIFLECFSHDYARWVTEIQYDQKGSIDKQPEANYSNKLHNICWNNYLKLRYEMYSIIPYILVGPRLEYNLIQSTSSPAITGKFIPLHVSAAAGAGLEFVSYTNFKFLVEAFYNPDVMPAYKTSALKINNKNFELRVGLKYEFNQRKERCNTPTYTE